MKSKPGIAFYLLICAFVIGGAIYAGQRNHDHCGECKLALGLNGQDTNFVSK